MQKKQYSDDLTNTEWAIIESMLPKGPRNQDRNPI